ncbi:MAG: aspartate/glutamate racemase family protein [Vicinamibacterales bacterium]
MRHVGLIGGIGPAATAFYYRHITRAWADTEPRLELTIVHADSRELVRNMAAEAGGPQAAVFEGLTRRLQAAGAAFVAVTSIAGHFCAREFEAVSPLPVVSILPAVRGALDRLGAERVGILGTRVAMASHLYGALEGLQVLLPEGDDFAGTEREYLAMALAGAASAVHRDYFVRVGRSLRQRGADVILLAGTDLFLAFDGVDPGFATLDCARAHVDLIVRTARE